MRDLPVWRNGESASRRSASSDNPSIGKFIIAIVVAAVIATNKTATTDFGNASIETVSVSGAN
jgi:hypothetical protein